MPIYSYPHLNAQRVAEWHPVIRQHEDPLPSRAGDPVWRGVPFMHTASRRRIVNTARRSAAAAWRAQTRRGTWRGAGGLATLEHARRASPSEFVGFFRNPLPLGPKNSGPSPSAAQIRFGSGTGARGVGCEARAGCTRPVSSHIIPFLSFLPPPPLAISVSPWSLQESGTGGWSPPDLPHLTRLRNKSFFRNHFENPLSDVGEG